MRRCSDARDTAKKENHEFLTENQAHDGEKDEQWGGRDENFQVLRPMATMDCRSRIRIRCSWTTMLTLLPVRGACLSMTSNLICLLSPNTCSPRTIFRRSIGGHLPGDPQQRRWLSMT